MKRNFQIAFGVVCFFLAHSVAQAQSLDDVLKKMDATAASFRSLQADFDWDAYQRVVDEHDSQKGTVYYRRNGQSTEMMAEVRDPIQKFVLYKDGELQLFEPKINQVHWFSSGGKGSEIESFLVLGFGASGKDLKQSFDVSLVGPQTVDGVATQEMQLLPKSDKLRNNISKIYLWIDMNRGISVQQQFFQPSGDYRLAKYSGVKMPSNIGNGVFQLKTDKKTQYIPPRG